MGKRESKWKRLLLHAGVPLAIIFVWFGLSGVGGPYFGKIDEVSSNDLASFLPKNAESTKVNDQLSKFQDSKSIPAIVVLEDDAKLSNEKREERIELWGVIFLKSIPKIFPGPPRRRSARRNRAARRTRRWPRGGRRGGRATARGCPGPR